MRIYLLDLLCDTCQPRFHCDALHHNGISVDMCHIRDQGDRSAYHSNTKLSITMRLNTRDPIRMFSIVTHVNLESFVMHCITKDSKLTCVTIENIRIALQFFTKEID